VSCLRTLIARRGNLGNHYLRMKKSHLRCLFMSSTERQTIYKASTLNCSARRPIAPCFVQPDPYGCLRRFLDTAVILQVQCRLKLLLRPRLRKPIVPRKWSSVQCKLQIDPRRGRPLNDHAVMPSINLDLKEQFLRCRYYRLCACENSMGLASSGSCN